MFPHPTLFLLCFYLLKNIILCLTSVNMVINTVQRCLIVNVNTLIYANYCRHCITNTCHLASVAWKILQSENKWNPRWVSSIDEGKGNRDLQGPRGSRLLLFLFQAERAHLCIILPAGLVKANSRDGDISHLDPPLLPYLQEENGCFQSS